MEVELQQLKDIHLPQPIHMWPIAPGWILVYVIILLLFSCVLYFFYKSMRNRYTVKFALTKLNNLQHQIQENPNINAAAEISTLLRRTALYYFPREDIAGLSGKHWLEFLNRSGKTMNFTQDDGCLLTDAPYQKNHKTDLTPLFELTRDWLKVISKNNSRYKYIKHNDIT